MSFDVPDGRADDAMAAIGREFVDLNELRVATELEVQEMLGTRYPGIERRVSMITQALNAIFEKEHTLSLDRLKTISKRDARQFLRDLPDMHPFVEAYVMLFAFDGHAVPIDEPDARLPPRGQGSSRATPRWTRPSTSSSTPSRPRKATTGTRACGGRRRARTAKAKKKK